MGLYDILAIVLLYFSQAVDHNDDHVDPRSDKLHGDAVLPLQNPT